MPGPTADQIADHQRDYRKHEPNPGRDKFMAQIQSQRFAVASLVGQCEAIVSSGKLAEPAEMSLRLLIANTLAAFDMPSKRERETA